MRETMAKLLMLVLLLSVRILYAGSTTWKLNPTSNDWNTAENWTPETIPSSETDVATFSASNTTNLICGDAPGGEGTSTIVGDVVFTEGAGAYTITITPVFDNIFPSIIEFHRGGITNNSGVVQNFVAANSGTTKASGRIYFMNSASAGENVVITNEGGASATGDGVYGGFNFGDPEGMSRHLRQRFRVDQELIAKHGLELAHVHFGHQDMFEALE